MVGKILEVVRALETDGFGDEQMRSEVRDHLVAAAQLLVADQMGAIEERRTAEELTTRSAIAAAEEMG